MGGTLEDIYYDDATRLKATLCLQAILANHGLDPRMDTPHLYQVVKAGMAAYLTWREASEIELPGGRVWAEFVFPNHGLPADRLAAIGEELAFFYDTRFYNRSLRPEVPALLAALKERGLRLGVISNVVSLRQVSYNLKVYGLAHYFEAVVTSSGLGYRKPSPRIFLEATRLLNLPPAACAYVGDTVSRDVVGARRAGYGLAIQIKSFLTDKADKETDTEQPDAVIGNLMEVVGLVSG